MTIYSKEKSRVIILLLFILYVNVLFGQSRQSVIKGSIRDDKGNPIELATISIKESQISTHSDKEGNFFMRVLPGKQTINISYLGYKPYQAHVDAKPHEPLIINIKLEQTENSLGEVVVEGKSAVQRINESAYNVIAIDANRLANSSTDLAHAMQQISGVKLRESGGVGSDMTFSLNGFSGKHIKFFMDGVPMEGMGGSFQINNIPINLADRIEVYKGVVPIGFGADAIGGAVNIVTKQRQRTYVDASYSYGSFQTHRTSVNIGSVSKNGLLLELNAFQNYSKNDYKINTFVTIFNTNSKGQVTESSNENDIVSVKRFHDTYHNETVIGKIGFVNKSFADRMVLAVNLGQSAKEIQTGVVQEVVFGQKRQKTKTFMPSFQYIKNNLLKKGLNVTYTANYNYNLRQNIDTSAYRYNWYGQSYYRGVLGESDKYQDSKFADKNWNSTLTTNYYINEKHSISFNDVFSSFKTSLNSSVADAELTAADSMPKITRKNVMGLSYKFSIPQRFNISVFGKYYYQYVSGPADTSSDTSHKKYEEFSKTYNLFSYGIAGTYFWNNFQLKASFERALRLPTENELFGDQDLELGQASLKPEKSYNYNVGLSYSKLFANTHFVYIDASFMLRNTSDYIKRDIKPASGDYFGQFTNWGSVKNVGFNGEVRYGYKKLISLGANITSQNIRNYERYYTNSQVESTSYKSRIPNTPYFFANSDLEINWNNFFRKDNTLSFGYDNNYIHEFPRYSEANGSSSSKKRIPTQFSHNLSLTYVMSKGMYNVSLECSDITNEKLYDNYSLQKPGRAFYMKFRYYFSK